MSATATPFLERVRSVLLAIPAGEVLAYGEVALLAGRPGGARAVARALQRLRNVPWWRVVRADGTLAPQVAHAQARHLRAEGVSIRGNKVCGASASHGPGQPRARGAKRQVGCAQSSCKSCGS